MVYKRYFLVLGLIAILIWLAVFSVTSKLAIIVCDVGQGDAILIQKGSNQILIDGGPDQSVLSCLGKYMPFWDRKLEGVFLTHPEEDHYGGLIYVFDRYEVDTFFQNDLEVSSTGYQVLQSKVGGKVKRVVYPTRGMVTRLGKIYLDILHPYQGFTNKNLNNYSIVIKLSYLDFKAIFLGDIENSICDQISVLDKVEKVDYIKIPHHGSKNGISEKLIEVTKPNTAVISVGKNNRYGHPAEEVIEILKRFNIKVLRTDELGDVTINP